ncbi:hypothetical protein CR513_33819, partial [Mucuna pruriens]
MRGFPPTKLLLIGGGPFQVLECVNENSYKLDLPMEFGGSATFNACKDDVSAHKKDKDPKESSMDLSRPHVPRANLAKLSPKERRPFNQEKGSAKEIRLLAQSSLEWHAYLMGKEARPKILQLSPGRQFFDQNPTKDFSTKAQHK